jgi:hypothetical protein
VPETPPRAPLGWSYSGLRHYAAVLTGQRILHSLIDSYGQSYEMRVILPFLK